MLVENARSTGSSPRARGTDRRRCQDAVLPPVHPRARGERRAAVCPIPMMVGSSPRARGTGPCSGCTHSRSRFIPARAGNGFRHPARSNGAPVHPRARGERNLLADTRISRLGSSPRARGTAWRQACRIWTGRFIPARAGNGCAQNAGRERSTVHPRARGERARSDHAHGMPTGSSPRARGTVGSQSRRSQTRRFIPARAGNGKPHRSRRGL